MMKRISFVFLVALGVFAPQFAQAAAATSAQNAVVDLKFGEMFVTPVGPRGLEPSEKLRSLDGRRVRLVGYRVQAQPASPEAFLLSPLPVSAGDEDESLADDIPANAVLVRIPAGRRLPQALGLLRLTGVLHVGQNVDIPSGRSAALSFTPDAATLRALERQPAPRRSAAARP